LLLTVFWSLTL